MKLNIEVNVFVHRPADEDTMLVLAKILTLEKQIMSKISEFATAQKAFNDSISNSLTGLSGDIDTLNAKITELQSTSGAITAEDQALLDELQAQGQALAARVATMDELVPPVVPTTPTDPTTPPVV